ncbi:putative Ig domain-containing protein [Azonexus sp.]|uniref:putative Ig domain-containing protein n=1 Tax=Azonexus sp. TaxID=1872668 RepID=UPI00283AABD7|nr:putative Ig domain-containing protein [Azonexus sp.]
MAEENTAYGPTDKLLDDYAQSGIDPVEALAVLAIYPLPQALAILLENALTTRTHAEWEALYTEAKEFKGAPNPLDKVANPALIDVGYGNFKISTAIDLVVKHANKAEYSALDLTGYLSNYSQLVADLADPDGELTAKLYGLYMKEEAEAFFISKNAYDGQWESLPQEFRDALLVTFTNIGKEGIDSRWKENTNNGSLPYEPQPALITGGGMNHLLNAKAIGIAIGLDGYGDNIEAVADFVALAEADTGNALAYRYALVKLRHVALPTLDYSTKNQNGELDLYDPDTGTGTLTEQYLKDRAAMLEWKLRFDLADKSYGSEWDTDTVNGNWDFIDMSLKPGGAPLKLAIDGSGVSLYDHQIVFGSNAAETLNGSGDSDHLYGGGGNDTLLGGAGNDYLEGNAGNDDLYGGKGNDTLIGGQGTDTYYFYSGDGWDTIEDSDGLGKIVYDNIQLKVGKAVGDSGMVWQEKISSGTITYILTDWTENGVTTKRLSIQGPDGGMFIKNWQPGQLGITLEGAEPPTPKTPPVRVVEGAQGTLFGGDATDNEIIGTDKSDVLAGGRGADYLFGGAGDDFMWGDMTITSATAKSDTSEGWSAGLDNQGRYDFRRWSYNTTDGTQVPSPGSPGYTTSELAHVGENDTLDGGAGNDILHGGAGDDLLIGGLDNDTLFGGYGDDILIGGDGTDNDQDGDDVLVGGAGNDTLFGGKGNDTLVGDDGPLEDHGNDYLDGGEGDDILWGDGGSDTLFGGNGDDYLEGDADASLLPGQYHGNDYLDGGAGNDTLIGGGGNDTLYGGDGDDYLEGDDDDLAAEFHGDDYLDGGAGNDTLYGGGGNDTLDGGAGDDFLYGEDGNDLLLGGSGKDVLKGGVGDDTLDGGADDDTLYGDDGNDLLLGGAGKDVLKGGAGDDTLDGGADDDTLYGDDGNDLLIGGGGRDYLAGGAGDDTYRIGATDAPVENNTLETIDDTEGANRLELDVSLDELLVSRNGNNLILYWSGKTQGLWIAGGAQGAIAEFVLSGATLSWTQFMDHFFGPDTTEPIQLTGGAGDDLLLGGAGNDTLFGMGGNDTLLGGDGDDYLAGDAAVSDLAGQFHGNDLLEGGAGSDTLYGGGGNDTLLGGDGNDLLAGDASSSDLPGEFHGDDYLDGGAGNDTLFGGGGNDTLIGGDGDDHLAGDDGTLAGEFHGDDYLNGGAGNDTLIGGGGNDTLIGGDGDDYLIGDDNALAAEFHGDDYLDGGAGNDTLSGGGGDDTLIGGTGNDYLVGGDGADTYVFNLGDGQDIVVEASGGNVICFGEGILPESLSFVSGSAWNGVAYVSVVQIGYGDQGDTVLIQGGLLGNFEHIEFANGVVWNQAMIQMVLDGVTINNHAPTVGTLVPALHGMVGTAFDYTLPADAITDPDAWDAITYRIEMPDGSAVPGWLQFDAASGTLYGTPQAGDAGTLQFVLWGTDNYGATASQTITLTIGSTNRAPELTTALDDQMTAQGASFSYALPAAAFTDPDGDALIYSATLADGSALPAWLTFDAQTQTFTGTPANGDVGNLQLRVTATDPAGASASQLFMLEVANVNDAPAVGTLLSDQQAEQDSVFTYTLPADSFTDVDAGDVLSYSATLENGDPLPDWLTFDAATQTFTGTPANGDVGNLQLRVTATDQAGASASQSFTLEITSAGGENQAPITAPDNAEVSEDGQTTATGNVLANDHDPDGDVLQVADPGIRTGEYGVLTLQSDGSYSYTLDNASAKVQGLGAGETVTEHFAYLASDGVMQSSGELTVTIHGANDAPEVGVLLSDQQAEQDAPFSFTVPVGSFYDIDVGDVLTYSTTLDNGGPLPAWLTFDAETKTFTGTPADGDVGSLNVRVTATDLAGASASQLFMLEVTSDSDPQLPITLPDSAEVAEDGILTGNVLANDTNPGEVTSFQIDGDATVYTAGDTATFTEGSLTLAGNGDYSFTPAPDYAGAVPQVRYTTSSGSSSTLDIMVTPVADQPIITVELGEPTESGSASAWFTIDTSNHTRTDQGYTVKGFKSNGDPGVLATFGGGIGVGRYEDPRENPGDAAGEISYNPTTNTSEKLVVTFDAPVAKANVALRELNTQEYARVMAYDGDNNLIFAETVLGKGSSVDTPVAIAIDGTLISRIEFTAPGMSWHLNGSIRDYDDFVVRSVSYETVSQESMTVCPIKAITVTPTDIDHSEQVTGITVSLPDGVLLSAGTNNGDGSWTLPMENDGNYVCTVDPVTGAVSIAGLEMWILPTFSGEVAVKVTATVVDRVVVGLDTLVDTGVFDSTGAGMVLMGSSGDDVLVGGGGNDILIGGAGDDIYVFSMGDGQDLIHDNLGANTVRFLDVKSDEITLLRRGDDLTILYGESDSVTIQDHFADASCQMASYAFADVTLVGVDLVEMYGM